MLYDCDREEDSFEISRNLIEAIVFSAMAIESYLNNYISVCIGDDDYYKHYDSLNMIDKLDLIKRFIYHDSTRDSEKAFTQLRELQKTRNELVHNKPSSTFCGKSADEIFGDIPEDIGTDPQWKKIIELTTDSVKKDMRKGLISLKAIKSVADYIDKHDEGANAISMIFWPTVFDDDSYSCNVKKKIYRMLGIELQIYKSIES